MEYAPHIITLILYALVIIFAIRNYFMVGDAHNNNELRFIIRMYVIITVYSSSLFIFNQSNWVLNSHGDLVGSTADILWIHGDHAVALTWLVGQCLLRYYLKFKSISSTCVNYRRRSSDD